MEFTYARGPVKAAGRDVVFVGMPETNAIGGIDAKIAVIAPAAVGVGLATRAGEHYGFSLSQVI